MEAVMHPTLRQDLAATIVADRHREAEQARAVTRRGRIRLRRRARRAVEAPLPSHGLDPAPR
jgi:hypothetical protein